VYAVQLPGREDRLADTPLRGVPQIVDHLIAGWSDVHAPVLFGHSLGAVISYELAVRLERQGVEVAGVIASGHRAPHLPRRHEPIHGLPRHLLVEALTRLGGTPPEVLDDSSLLDLMLPAIRADFEAGEVYERERPDPLRCPVTAVAARDDPLVTLDEMAAWRAYTRDRFNLIAIPGDHFGVYRCPDLTQILRPAE
jgi:surfactin synthase thioesterase subunit